jgi:hypothetical protein
VDLSVELGLTDFRKGRRLGSRDHVVAWIKPRICPGWLTREQYDAFPDTLEVREIKIDSKALVTTLLCADQAPKKALSELYASRWNIELDLRNIKTTLGMERLRCKTPAMNEKELWTSLLAYNLIRLLMTESARQADVLPRLLSFKHSLQLWPAWSHAGPPELEDASVLRFPCRCLHSEIFPTSFLLPAVKFRIGRGQPGNDLGQFVPDGLIKPAGHESSFRFGRMARNVANRIQAPRNWTSRFSGSTASSSFRNSC